MSTWNPNNRACTTLWATLFKLKQLSSSFSESGALKMSDLLYYNPLGSAADRRVAARILADQLDNIFRNGRGAIFEKDMDRMKAMDLMIAILLDADKLTEELALTVDLIYRFWEEPSNPDEV